MPTPTQLNEARINQLTQLVQALSSKLDTLDETSGKDIDRLQDNLRELRGSIEELRKDAHETSKAEVRHDERLKALEKGSDRRWQLAPMILSAAALLVSILVGVANVVIAIWMRK